MVRLILCPFSLCCLHIVPAGTDLELKLINFATTFFILQCMLQLISSISSLFFCRFGEHVVVVLFVLNSTFERELVSLNAAGNRF